MPTKKQVREGMNGYTEQWKELQIGKDRVDEPRRMRCKSK